MLSITSAIRRIANIASAGYPQFSDKSRHPPQGFTKVCFFSRIHPRPGTWFSAKADKILAKLESYGIL